MTRQDKQKLLEEANEAYRKGNPIMGDAEYDALEKELNLENNNIIGEKHSPELTIRHPFIMGSLSKVQVHSDDNGFIDWDDILKQINSYINHKAVIITPKYDGCSFELYIRNNHVESISTRGDGNWGRDIYHHIVNRIPDIYKTLGGEYTLRGELLVNKNVFDTKWANEYANTRAFVAGVTGQDYDGNDAELLEKLNDIDVVIYDYRENYDLPFDNGWVMNTWLKLPKSQSLPDFYIEKKIDNAEELKDIYYQFEKYREECIYSLDGFVIRPVDIANDFTNSRPKDSVAVKFLPMTVETIVNNITWELGKTGEYFPIVYYNPVKIDGKICVKASGHNYGTLIDKGIGCGAKIIISMAGDIIPYIYKVVEPVENNINIPENTYIEGCHLMKNMSDEERLIEEFKNSCITLNVPGLGEAQINKLIEGIKVDCQPNDFFGDKGREFPISIFELYPLMLERHIGGKNGAKIASEFQKILSNISLDTVIETLNFRFCGKKVSKAIANYLITGTSDFESMAKEGWEWAMDESSIKYNKLMFVLKCIGKDIQYYKTIMAQNTVIGKKKTYIIMTGEPNNYPTKADFLRLHPEYEETTSWKKVEIVFTNSMDSNTGKMKKAKEKNIRIEIY